VRLRAAFDPGVLVVADREEQAFVQCLAADGVLDDELLHVVEADAVHVVHGAFEVEAFLAVELQEGAEYSITSSSFFTLQRNCATSVLMPPLPAT
jgi:hypothetical protein